MDLVFMELRLMSSPTTLADLVLDPDPDPQRKRPKIAEVLHQKESQVEVPHQDLEVRHLNKKIAVHEVYQPKLMFN
jgi:hypothetical protein